MGPIAIAASKIANDRRSSQLAVHIARSAMVAYRAANRTPDDEAADALREAGHALICAARSLSVFGWWDTAIEEISRGGP